MTWRHGLDIDPADWWAGHDEGTNGRPRPGTRVLLRDGRRGTVARYEGCWQAATFPVVIDRTGQSLMLVPSDVTVLAPGVERAAVEAAG